MFYIFAVQEDMVVASKRNLIILQIVYDVLAAGWSQPAMIEVSLQVAQCADVLEVS